MRHDGRKTDQIRAIKITRGYSQWAEGSVLIEIGDTKVLCNATVEEKVPSFLKGSGQGWVTAEYGMLPRATQTRTMREAKAGKPTGRTSEIQRLIGRSLRSVVDLSCLGERTILIDCDVLQANGGTRTAAITGGFVALALALRRLQREGQLNSLPLKAWLAAVSVGNIEGVGPCLDLDYAEDKSALVDMNIVMTSDEDFVEIQGSAEGKAFSRQDLAAFLELGTKGISQLIVCQKNELGEDFI